MRYSAAPDRHAGSPIHAQQTSSLPSRVWHTHRARQVLLITRSIGGSGCKRLVKHHAPAAEHWTGDLLPPYLARVGPLHVQDMGLQLIPPSTSSLDAAYFTNLLTLDGSCGHALDHPLLHQQEQNHRWHNR